MCFKPTTEERLADKEEMDCLVQHHRGSCGALPVGALPALIAVKGPEDFVILNSNVI